MKEKNSITVATNIRKPFSVFLVNYGTKKLAQTAFLALLSIVLPGILAHTPGNQWITGTIVNTILFFACYQVGIFNAILIGVIPSSIAFFRGLLPIPLASMIPYIILGNAVLIAVFGLLKIKSLTIRVIIASFIKFLVIFGAASLLVSIPGKIIQMMQWPQLFTALAGGLIATTIIKTLEKNKLNKNEK